MKKTFTFLFLLSFALCSGAKAEEAKKSFVGEWIDIGNKIINNSRDNLTSSSKQIYEERKKTQDILNKNKGDTSSKYDEEYKYVEETKEEYREDYNNYVDATEDEVVDIMKVEEVYMD